MVGVNAILFGEMRHFKCLAQTKWDKRFIVGTGREQAFIYRKHDQVIKIKCSGFQKTHYLQPIPGFMSKWHFKADKCFGCHFSDEIKIEAGFYMCEF